MLGYKIIALTSLVAYSSAQTLPTCVLSCYQASFTAAPDCTSTNFTCLCQSAPFQQAVGQCLSTTCLSEAEIQAGTQFGVTTCKAQGITVAAPSIPLNNPNVAASGSASGSASGAASTSASTPASGSGSSTTAAVVPVTSASGSTSRASSGSSVPTLSGTSVAAPSSTVTPSSANKLQVGGILAVVLGLVLIV